MRKSVLLERALSVLFYRALKHISDIPGLVKLPASHLSFSTLRSKARAPRHSLRSFLALFPFSFLLDRVKPLHPKQQ